MPAVPLKDRWWRTTIKGDPRNNWCTLWANQTPLSGAWHGMESLNDHYKTDAVNWSVFAPPDPYVADKLGACGICHLWDQSKVSAPIDVPLTPTNKSGGVSPHFYRKMWMARVFGTLVPVMHRRLLDVIGDDFDDDILVGDVYVLGGDRVPDLVSVLDRRSVPRRERYARRMFRYAGSDGFRPCHACGRVVMQKRDPEYLLTSEIESKSPRILWGSVLISPETRRKSNFENREEWPSLRVMEVPQLDMPADPIPTPWPESWDELERVFDAKGIRFPRRRISVFRKEVPGPWIRDRIERLGEAACLAKNSQDDLYWTMTFYVRYRALFEPKVAERVDHWTDEQLYNFVKDSHEFSRGRTPYFPV